MAEGQHAQLRHVEYAVRQRLQLVVVEMQNLRRRQQVLPRAQPRAGPAA